MTATAFQFARERRWWKVDRDDPRARSVVDGTGRFNGHGPHYSRQTPGADDFMGSGKNLVLLTDDECAVWGAIENRVPGKDEWRWRCSVFRNLGAGLSSELIREATSITHDYWRMHYGGLPSVPLTTEVDPGRTRRKRDPGRCFIKAGWRRVCERNGLVVLEAP